MSLFGFNRWAGRMSPAERRSNLERIGAAAIFAYSEDILATPYTLQAEDGGKFKFSRSSTPISIILESHDVEQLPADWETSIVQAGAGPVTLITGSGVTLDRRDNTYAITNGFASIVTIKRIGLNSFLLLGDYTAFDEGHDLVFHSTQQVFHGPDPVEHPV